MHARNALRAYLMRRIMYLHMTGNITKLIRLSNHINERRQITKRYINHIILLIEHRITRTSYARSRGLNNVGIQSVKIKDASQREGFENSDL